MEGIKNNYLPEGFKFLNAPDLFSKLYCFLNCIVSALIDMLEKVLNLLLS